MTTLLYVLLEMLPIGIVVLLARPFGPVTRARLERFARRQALVITPTNGARVIGYLATTRRWRAGGMIVALAVATVQASVNGHQFNIGLGFFVGWFVGAVIAEWRVGAGSRDGVRRAASLVPRGPSDYVPTTLRMTMTGAFTVVACFTFAVLIGARGDRLALGGLLLATIAAGAGITAVCRHVLTRPQALAEADVVLADDALRSRSLHVLMGSGLAFAGYLLSVVSTIAAEDTTWGGANSASALTAIGILLLPVLGILAATAPFRPRIGRVAALEHS